MTPAIEALLINWTGALIIVILAVTLIALAIWRNT